MATLNEIRKLLESEPVSSEFKPYSEMNKASDALTIYFKPDADYSKRLTDHITLYLSLETNELVGCRIKGISGIIEDLPNYLEVSQPNLKMSMLFLPFRGTVDDEFGRKTINELAKATREMELEPV